MKGASKAVEQALSAAALAAELERVRGRIVDLTDAEFPRFAGLLDLVGHHHAVTADETLANAIELVRESFHDLWEKCEQAVEAETVA